MRSRRPTPRPARRELGFSLVEAVLSCLIIGVALVPALGMLGATAVDRRSHSDLICGVALARQLLTEIVQCHYADPDTESGETRATWDDVSDYNGFTETSPTTKDGTAIAGATGWNRSVAVVLVSPAAPDSVSGADLGLKKITVTVTSPAGKTCTLSALRSNAGSIDHQATTASTYASGLTITIQPTGGDATSTGVDLPNQSP